MNSLSIILFGFNESKTIKSTFDNTLKVLKKISSDYEIIIIDDGSTDNSKEVIKDIILNNKLVFSIFNKTNIGIGMTLVKGYNLASKKYICSIPLDGQFNPLELLKIKKIHIQKNNFISFFRSKNYQYSFFRKFLSKMNFLFNFFILGILLKDVNWVKIYNKDHLKKLNLSLKSSLVETEICSKLIISKIHPIEVKSNYLDRTHGKSKVNTYKILSMVIFEIPHLVYIILMFRIKITYMKIMQKKIFFY